MAGIVPGLEAGINAGGFLIYAEKVTTGRFVEEKDADVFIKYGEMTAHLLYAKIFTGRKPDYLPWTEVYGINKNVYLGRKRFSFYGSEAERKLFSFISEKLPPGGDLFVEYDGDPLTKRQLELGYPVCVTRLGSILFGLGFTWFKDWYYPEGFLEGGKKIQAQKPLNATSRKRNLSRTARILEKFLSDESRPKPGRYLSEALLNARKILSSGLLS